MATGDDGVDGGGGTDTNANRGNIEDAENVANLYNGALPGMPPSICRPPAVSGALAPAAAMTVVLHSAVNATKAGNGDSAAEPTGSEAFATGGGAAVCSASVDAVTREGGGALLVNTRTGAEGGANTQTADAVTDDDGPGGVAGASADDTGSGVTSTSTGSDVEGFRIQVPQAFRHVDTVHLRDNGKGELVVVEAHDRYGYQAGHTLARIHVNGDVTFYHPQSKHKIAKFAKSSAVLSTAGREEADLAHAILEYLGTSVKLRRHYCDLSCARSLQDMPDIFDSLDKIAYVKQTEGAWHLKNHHDDSEVVMIAAQPPYASLYDPSPDTGRWYQAWVAEDLLDEDIRGPAEDHFGEWVKIEEFDADEILEHASVGATFLLRSDTLLDARRDTLLDAVAYESDVKRCAAATVHVQLQPRSPNSPFVEELRKQSMNPKWRFDNQSRTKMISSIIRQYHENYKECLGCFDQPRVVLYLGDRALDGSERIEELCIAQNISPGSRLTLAYEVEFAASPPGGATAGGAEAELGALGGSAPATADATPASTPADAEAGATESDRRAVHVPGVEPNGTPSAGAVGDAGGADADGGSHANGFLRVAVNLVPRSHDAPFVQALRGLGKQPELQISNVRSSETVSMLIHHCSHRWKECHDRFDGPEMVLYLCEQALDGSKVIAELCEAQNIPQQPGHALTLAYEVTAASRRDAPTGGASAEAEPGGALGGGAPVPMQTEAGAASAPASTDPAAEVVDAPGHLPTEGALEGLEMDTTDDAHAGADAQLQQARKEPKTADASDNSGDSERGSAINGGGKKARGSKKAHGAQPACSGGSTSAQGAQPSIQMTPKDNAHFLEIIQGKCKDQSFFTPLRDSKYATPAMNAWNKAVEEDAKAQDEASVTGVTEGEVRRYTRKKGEPLPPEFVIVNWVAQRGKSKTLPHRVMLGWLTTREQRKLPRAFCSFTMGGTTQRLYVMLGSARDDFLSFARKLTVAALEPNKTQNYPFEKLQMIFDTGEETFFNMMPSFDPSLMSEAAKNEFIAVQDHIGDSLRRDRKLPRTIDVAEVTEQHRQQAGDKRKQRA